jgi:hypothetical protein
MVSFEPANLGFSGNHNNHYTTESDVIHAGISAVFVVEEMHCLILDVGIMVAKLLNWCGGNATIYLQKSNGGITINLCRVQLFFLILNVILVF